MLRLGATRNSGYENETAPLVFEQLLLRIARLASQCRTGYGSMAAITAVARAVRGISAVLVLARICDGHKAIKVFLTGHTDSARENDAQKLAIGFYKRKALYGATSCCFPADGRNRVFPDHCRVH